MLEDIRDNLGVLNLEDIRILNRYDIENITDVDYEKAKNTIFSEPPVDDVYEETIEISPEERVFAVEYLPGQYDQRADSAKQCIQLISQSVMPEISVAKVYILKGEITTDEFNKIKNYCINPVDSREAILEKPKSLLMDMEYPGDIESYEGFIDMSREEVFALRDQLDTAMSQEDLLFCQKYFKEIENRNPTKTEIKVIDTYWSDHCRHTTFQTRINRVEIEDGFYKPAVEKAYELYLEERKNVYKDRQKDICLMDIAVLGMKALREKGILDNLDVYKRQSQMRSGTLLWFGMILH